MSLEKQVQDTRLSCAKVNSRVDVRTHGLLNGLEISGGANLIHPILALRLRRLQRLASQAPLHSPGGVHRFHWRSRQPIETASRR